MDSVDDWRRGARQKKAVADAMVGDRFACKEAWYNTGIAIEFALKAIIMKNGRFNQWPDRNSRPDLHVHDLKSLFAAANIDLTTLGSQQRAYAKTVLNWNRAHDYVGDRMPRKVAQDMHTAAFDPADGIFTWLMTLSV
jgi:hypothetical protein